MLRNKRNVLLGKHLTALQLFVVVCLRTVLKQIKGKVVPLILGPWALQSFKRKFPITNYSI